MDTGGKMFKKIINPNEELSYKLNSVDTRYLINEGDKSIGIFAATKDLSVPTQISPQNICFFVTEGEIQITVDDKVFDIKQNEMILIPKTSAYTINFIQDSKAFFVRI